MKKTELLIPVGNYDCLLAAIHNGADAVYLGGKKFGARAFSNNFDEREMVEAIKLCHLYGVKIYVTVNTMIFNEEVKEVMEYLNFLYLNNVDAVIMQDIGLINLTRELLPSLVIHVSTQAHNHNTSGIKYFKDLGCTRVVFDRESSLKQIMDIDVDIEKEVFVYGALCVCYSGNCLFSALNGHRSANRGMCVGSCRLPYQLLKDGKKVDDGYLLSTKDLNTTGKIRELLDAGIDSLKIEGRMKGPEYVACVTKIYRRLIDAYYDGGDVTITDEELMNLYKTYNREFTEGYLFNEKNIINSKTSNHQGVKIGKIISGTNKRIVIKLSDDIHQEDAIRIDGTNIGMYLNTLYDKNGLLVSSVKKNNICQIDNKERILVKDYIGKDILKTIDYLLNKELIDYDKKKIPVDMVFTAKIGEYASLSIRDEKNEFVVLSDGVVERAKTAAIDNMRIREQLEKLGNTPFRCSNIKIDCDNNIFLSIKELNELRRKVVDELTLKRMGSKKKNQLIDLKGTHTSTGKGSISILVRNRKQLLIALRNNIDVIYVTDRSLYNEYKDNKNVYLRLDRVVHEYKDYNDERLLCTELGSILRYAKNNKVKVDYYLNVGNDYTINTLKRLGVLSSTLSVELSQEQIENIKDKGDSELIVYGYLECMIVKNNIFNINNEETYLVNNKKNKYKVISDGDYTHIFNFEPVNYLDKMYKYKGFLHYRIELLDENEVQVQSIINKIKDVI